ncbi:hypothetical protein [Phytomonospora endophytica]|uniref:ATP-grasp domain-containing protein n=1 Tax=Phytomonospora endophytica TaxID=714109 RepID=A0A841G109_9ACTN|nr:hypothetical protein [Phytomonospora endophytica]MBB6037850.1 hypothetical protein [Phytomonospora endophytica]GIG68749.1 hypothetical protein Pen01_50440 [Phytomonospora endophytica]
MTGGDVVIVTERDDMHAAAMAAVLRRDHGITPVRLDQRDFPADLGSFHIGTGAPARRTLGDLRLDDVRSVWWRRPHHSVVPVSAQTDDDVFRQAECDGFAQGVLWSLPARWVNDPRAERFAVRKVVQLEAAVRAGLAVPETLVTNDPDAAEEFIGSRPGKVIYKRTGTGRAAFSETRLFAEADRRRLSTIRAAPTTFQDYVEAEADLRVAWVAGRELTVRIDSQSGIGKVDSRLDTSVTFAPFDLPGSVSVTLTTLMESLGLVFGVVDVRLGVDGEFYFLEVNTQGQFAYMEIKAGVPIFGALAGLLVNGPG